MRLRALTVVAFLVMASSVTTSCARPRRAEYQPGTGPHVAGQQGWAWPEVSPPGMGISCRMPAAPRHEQRTGREDDGAFYRTTTARAEVPYGSFGIIVTEWEGGLVGDPLEAASEIADNIFTEQQLTQRRSERLDIPGYYGREDTGIARNGVFVALRQFVGKRRIYVAVAIVTHAAGPLGTAETFMSSVRLDADDTLLPLTGSSTALLPIYMPETNFAVRMPPLASRQTEDLELEGRTVVTHSFATEVPNARLRVRVVDLARGVDEETLEQLTQVLGLGEETGPTSASGFPGIVYTRSTASVSIESRLFITASRVYVLEVAQPASQPSSAIAREFFESFRIL